ncbi:MAG: Gfo/Idh/MocA family oxidoreductase, partial [Candidatus Hydrogenedentes bacterium]|nr:Gfo/Idh/MocA family oxidoreductase [Candidatus Hydrogenedentota bacterium]
MAIRVAIIGARGVGRHHARWWTLEGANVCAIAGTTIHNVDKARRALEDDIGFEGRGYVDINAMLVREVPDVVDVCSPPDCHARHVRMALEAGCSVLCEKPFVYDETWPHEDLLAEAWELVDLAAAYNRQLAVCTQYAAGARMIADLWERFRKNEPITRYLARLETPAKGRAADPQRIWVDLAPHLFSAL